MFDLTGKTALITGASSGLGASFAKVLSESGARVVIAARRLERLESLASEIKADGGAALPIAMDVTSPESVDAGFARVTAELGEPADILINNAGLSREAFFTRMSEEDWSTVVDTNYTAVWRVAKVAANAMMSAGKPGSIINIASITAHRPSHTLSAYASSKAAVDHLTRIMALEMARYHVRVNALAPGYFLTAINEDFFGTEEGAKMTDRIAMRRIGDVRELAGPLLLLASDAGSYMTGTTITVDGGHTLSPL